MLFASVGWDHIGSYTVKDVCIHNPETRNSWEGITEGVCYCMVVVLLQYGLYSLTFVIRNCNNLILNSYDESESDWPLKYVLHMRSFVSNKLREDVTLVLKHTIVGMLCEMLFMMFYCW
jgi:hypothetical protein